MAPAGCQADCTLNPDPCGPPGIIIFVDQDAVGANDGSSWIDAYTSLFFALNAAAPGDQVWVAEGVYTAVAPNLPVANLPDHVQVYGGFIGGEGSLVERPLPLAPTVFDGDFTGDDGVGAFADNSRHVMVANYVDCVTVADIVVTGGRATGGGQDDDGAGLLSVGSDLSLIDVHFLGNFAQSEGAGIYAQVSHVYAVDTVLEANVAQWSGGAVWTSGTGLVFVGSVFEGNNAPAGAGIYLGGSAATLVEPLFHANTAGNGAGIRMLGSTLTISDGVFDGNVAAGGGFSNGGAIQANEYADITITGSLFVGNQANDGGAIFSEGPIAISSSTFTANTATGNGGAAVLNGVPLTYGEVVVNQVLFEGNVAAGDGGAIFRGAGYNFEIHEAEFLSNAAAGNGGAAAFTSASATVFDGVFDGNTSDGLGGAIFASNELLLFRASFTNNTADAGAGAVHFRYGQLRRASFIANAVTGVAGGGGAVSTSSDGGLSPPVAAVESCSFAGNSAPGQGGAILAAGPLRVSNSALHANTAGTDGGALFAPALAGGYPQIVSTSVYGNVAAGVGGIAVVPAGGVGIVHNVALWGNGTDIDDALFVAVESSCSEQALAGVGNVVALVDPFVLGPDGEVFLAPGSVCIDAGNDAAATTDYGLLGRDWQMMTTDPGGALDAPPVDIGVHYVPPS